jgi:uncharacterized protein
LIQRASFFVEPLLLPMRNPRWLTVPLLLLTALASPAEKVATTPAPTGYINDYAAVLTAPAKSELEDLCREVHDKTRAQLFVVTIKSLDGESVETFSNDLFHKWKIGDKKTSRGLLLLLAIDDHKSRIEVGTGFEGVLNDAKAGDITREMVPDLKAADYDGAVRLGVHRLAQIIATDSNVTIDALAEPDAAPASVPLAEPPPRTASTGTAVAIVFFFFFSMMAGFGFIVWRIRKGVREGFRRDHSGEHSRTFSSSSDHDSSSDDSSSSSSDDSFSGGDGGDSDGGGASGSW